MHRKFINSKGVYEGNLHCENGPAEVDANGEKRWYLHGYRHRIDGPAVEFSNGKFQWWLYGIRCESAEQFQRLAEISDEDLMLIILKYGKIENYFPNRS